jgi:PKD repeat protein
VSFNDQSTAPDSSIVDWLWEFGDGHESLAQDPTHTYAIGGTYIAKLTVTDNGGQKDSESKSLQIIDEQNETFFPSNSDIFSNQYFSKFVAGASAEYTGYGGENGNGRSLNVTGKTTYFSVKCLIVRYDQSDGDYSVLYLAQDSDRNIMCLRAFGYSEDDGNFDQDFSSSPVLFIPQNPHVRQTWTYIDGATVTVESLNDFVPQMSTGQGPFPNCLRTKWQDGSEIDYTYWSPTGLPVKFFNYNDGGVGGYELNKFIERLNAMTGIIFLLLQ